MGFPPWRLVVQTPAETLLDVSDVDWVEVHLVGTGPLTLLRGHAALIAETAAGPMYYGSGQDEQGLELEAGVLQVSQGRVLVFTAAGRALTEPQNDEPQKV